MNSLNVWWKKPTDSAYQENKITTQMPIYYKMKTSQMIGITKKNWYCQQKIKNAKHEHLIKRQDLSGF